MRAGAVRVMNQDQASRPLGWEHLITDGHVRAARLRRAQPALILTALMLMMLGLFFLWVVKPPTMKNERAGVLDAQVEREQRRVLEVFSGLPAPRIHRSALKDLMLLEPLTAANQQIITELNRTGQAPKAVAIDEVSPSAFWRAPWPQTRIVMTGNGKVKLAGALVNIGTVDAPQPARLLAVYRKKGDDWRMVTVQGPDFITLAPYPSVPIETIPVTVRPLLKTKE